MIQKHVAYNFICRTKAEGLPTFKGMLKSVNISETMHD